MKTTLLLIGGFGLLACQTTQAQTLIRVKGGANWQKSIPAGERYRHADFRPGTIRYVGGQSATGRLNYNILIGEMQFIDPRGDTLSLADENRIQAIQVAETTYLYDTREGYLEVLADYGSVKLASRLLFKTMRAEKNGGYGQSSGTSSIAQYKSFAGSNGQLMRLEQSGDVVLEKSVVYLLVDANRRVYRASKAAVLKLFAKEKPAINTYLGEQKIDFQKEEDLRKLLTYASGNL